MTQTQIKVSIQPQTQKLTQLKIMGRQIRLRWAATVCNPAQGHTATVHPHTHISPQGCDRLAAYWSTGSAGYEAKTCLKYFTPI